MFNGVFKDKTILVTGHTGFKGAWLSLWLSQLGSKVHGFSIDIPTTPSLFQAADLGKLVSDARGDVRDLDEVKRVFQAVQPDFVFHLAAQPIVKTSYEEPCATFLTNVAGTVNVLEAMRAAEKQCTGVIITSDKCYENAEWTWGYRENDRLGGKDPYSASKAAAECAIRAMHHSFFSKGGRVRIAPARAGNVIGGGDWAASRIVPDAARSWSQNEPVVIRCPHSTRPWQHVLEPLSGYLRLAQCLREEETLAGEPFNFGPRSEQNHTVLELLHALARRWDFPDASSMITIDEPPAFHEAGLLKLNCDKALHDLQWQPTLAYDETVEFTSAWYFHYYRQSRSDIRDFTLAQVDDYVSKARARSLAWTQ